MVAEPLITRYRPQTFEEVIGHNDVLPGLQRAMQGDSHPHAYVLLGEKGLGKTTIARLIGNAFDCEIIEVDAASHSKVEEMRELIEVGQHMSLHNEAGRRMFLIDECHRLSANAWDALLKTLEEPPPHLYFALCTTNATRVPDTAYSRCFAVKLKPLRSADMDYLLDCIAYQEQWQVLPDVLAAIRDGADGSPRMALTMLQSVHDAKSRDEVQRILPLVNTDPSKMLCHMFIEGSRDWPRYKAVLAQIEELDAYDETVLSVGRYMCRVMLRANNIDAAGRAWGIISSLTFPANTFDRKLILFSAIGRVIWGT